MKTIRLDNGAFNQELLRFTPADKVGWYGDDHGHFVDALLNRLIDERQEKVQLNEMSRDIVKLILCPTEELQRRVLKHAFAADGYELESGTEVVFASLFDAVGFGDYLSKKVNPKTGKPYIKKAIKGAKRNALDALMDGETGSMAAETVSKPGAVENVNPASVAPDAVGTQKLATAK